MDRNRFLKTTGLLGLGTTFSNSLWGKIKNPMKVKVVFENEGKQINCLGDNQLIKLTGKDTDGRFTAIYLDNPPNTQIPLHVHENEDEVYKVLEGEVEFTVGGKATLLKSGDIIFLPRNIPHTWKVVGTINAKVHLDVFPAGLENMFEELSKLPAGKPDLQKVTAICGKYKVQFV